MHRPACLALALVLLPHVANATGHKPARGDEFARVEAAATECLAQAILMSPGSMAKARAGLWYEAAGTMGLICRPEVDAMMRVRDEVEGRGAGMRYFRKTYARQLGKTLSARLSTEMRPAYATAEPPVDKE